MEHRILRSPLTPDQKEYSLHSAILGKFRYGLHLGMYTADEIDEYDRIIGGATKNIQGLPRNGTPNIFTSAEKEEYGLGMMPLQAVYAQAIWSGIQEAAQSEEDKGAVRTPQWRYINLMTRMRMSHVSRSTLGLIEYHSGTRHNYENLPKLWGGHQIKFNTLRKLNALLRYNITVQGTGSLLEKTRTPPPNIMRQLENATRPKTDKQLQGRTTMTKAGKIMEGEIAQEEGHEMGPGDEPKWRTTLKKDEPKKINFTSCLKLFAHFLDLALLTTPDGKQAMSTQAIRSQCQDVVHKEDMDAIMRGLKYLYPFLCTQTPYDVAKPGNFYESNTNRRLKECYQHQQQKGPLDDKVVKTTLPKLNAEQLEEHKAMWEQMGKPQEEIDRLLSLHPLTKNKEIEENVDTWTATEDQTAETHNKWSEEIDPKETNMDVGTAVQEKVDMPVAILAERTFLANHEDKNSQSK
ncbi:hypothetical protein CYMTET_38088 [Cymbomonas tetramitiformis]|uniref:Uncharacterized protein n=1 Tax=Cymbomonas tetramitiformis TaxID=36881 RepID=A0AAE0CEX4_9CHLO|nr:hypothetical protein CYMTET_38088 [Cymbomonas tetramitiformis]